jgi:hypothetical protein
MVSMVIFASKNPKGLSNAAHSWVILVKQLGATLKNNCSGMVKN